MFPRSFLRRNQSLQPVSFLTIPRGKCSTCKIKPRLQPFQTVNKRKNLFRASSYHFLSSSINHSLFPVTEAAKQRNDPTLHNQVSTRTLEDLVQYIEKNHSYLQFNENLPLQQEQILESLSTITSEQYAKVSSAELLQLLDTLSIVASTSDQVKVQQIIKSIITSIRHQRRVVPISDVEVVQLLHYSGGLGYDYKQLAAKDRKDIIQLSTSIQLNGPIASSLQQYTSFLSAMQKIHLDWRDLPVPFRKDLFAILATFQHSSHDTLHLHDIYQLMEAITELSILRVDRPTAEILEALLPLVIYAISSTPSLEKEQSIKLGYCVSHLLANGAIRGSDLEPDQYHNLFVAINHDISQLSLVEVGLMMTSLGEMQIKHHQIPTTTWWKLLDSIQTHLKASNNNTTNPISMSTLSVVLTGWKKLDCQWKDFMTSLQQSFLERIRQAILSECEDRKKISSSQHKGFSRLISYLGQLSMEWSEIPVSVKKALYRGIVCYSLYFDELTVSFLFTGLGKMRVRYEQLPENIQSQLWIPLEKKLSRMNGMMIFHLLQSLQAMKMSWKRLPAPIQEKLLPQFSQLATVSIPSHWLLSFLQQLIAEAEKHSLATDSVIREVVVKLLAARYGDRNSDLNEDSLENITSLLQMIGKSGLSWSSLPLSVQTTLIQRIKQSNRLSVQEVNNLLEGLLRMDEELVAVDQELMNHLLQSLDDNGITSSETEDSKAIVNIVYILSQLPSYAWGNYLSTASQSSFVAHLIRVLPHLSSQELMPLMFSLVLLSYQQPPTDLTHIVPIHQPVLQQLSRLTSANQLSTHKLSIHQLTVYYAWLLTLPPELRQTLLGSSLAADLFGREDVSPRRNPDFHLEIATKLLEAAKDSRDYQVTINYMGCKVPKYAMDLAILERLENAREEVVAFIEFQWPKSSRQPLEKRRIESNEADFKRYLYNYSHPTVPIWQIRMDEELAKNPSTTDQKKNRINQIVIEILQKLNVDVKKLE